MEWRPREDIRRDVVEVEVKLADDSHILPRLAVYGELQLEAQLDIPPEPDHARIDRARRPSGSRPLDRGLHGELHERDHAVEWCGQSHVAHEGLQVLQAVLEGEAPLHYLRVQLLLDLDATAPFVALVRGREGLVEASGRDGKPESPGHGD